MEEIDQKLLGFECLELEIEYWRGEMINNDNVRRCFVIDDTTAKAMVSVSFWLRQVPRFRLLEF